MSEARQDMHVHSTFSDGANSLDENVAEAESLGLVELGCVDHVRVDTDWVPKYAAAVAAMREQTGVRLQCGIEAKLLNTAGALDLPEPCAGVDAIYAADHQVPLDDGPHHPREIRAALEDGAVSAEEIIGAIIAATAGAVQSHDGVVIAHFFSILPKVGLDESEVSRSQSAGAVRRHRRCGRSPSTACRSCSVPTATAARRSGAMSTAPACSMRSRAAER